MTDRFPYPYTEKDAKDFIKICLSHKPNQIFAIEADGDFCGAIGIHPQEDIFKKNAEISYWVAEPFWRKGIAGRAIRQMIEYGCRTFDISRIYARVYGNNIPSQKVMEKCGFILEARMEKTIFKNGEFLDELIYAVRQ